MVRTSRSAALLLLALLGPAAVGQEAPGAAGGEDAPALAAPVADAEPAAGATTDDVEAPRDVQALDDIVPGEVFVNANAAYEAGDHAKAIELYETLLRRGYGTGHLHYNLGNAYLRRGELGRAIAAYRRSQAFLPRDEDVAANLAFARQSARDAIEPPEPGPVLETLFFWHYGLSRGELGTALVVLNLLLWSVLLVRLFRRGSEVLRWTTFALLLLVVAVGGSLAVHHLWPREVAVVVPQEIEVRSGTRQEDTVLFKLHAGTEVRVVDRREGSLRIALPGERRGGWIEAEHAELVVR